MLGEFRYTKLYVLCILHWPVLMQRVQVGYYACTEVPSYWHPATPSHCPTHATNILLLESFERDGEGFCGLFYWWAIWLCESFSVSLCSLGHAEAGKPSQLWMNRTQSKCPPQSTPRPRKLTAAGFTGAPNISPIFHNLGPSSLSGSVRTFNIELRINV